MALLPAVLVFAVLGVSAIAGVAYYAGTRQPGGSPSTSGGTSDCSMGVTAQQSHLATVTMKGRYKEVDIVFDDPRLWSGSGVVIAQESDALVILTNSHCIGLMDIANSEFGDPEVGAFSLMVRFAGHQDWVSATSFAETPTKGLDLALLRVPRQGLTEGVDYFVSPICPRSYAALGRSVVAIGSPSGLGGTETNGQVSAIRPFSELIDPLGRGVPTPWARELTLIQTDAAINHGNSGGPLFVTSSSGDRRQLVGINTLGLAP